jgi:hypothetical protein
MSSQFLYFFYLCDFPIPRSKQGLRCQIRKKSFLGPNKEGNFKGVSNKEFISAQQVCFFLFFLFKQNLDVQKFNLNKIRNSKKIQI